MFKTTGLYTSHYGARNSTRSWAAPEKIEAARSAGWKRGKHPPIDLDRISVEFRSDGSLIGLNCWVGGEIVAGILVYEPQDGFFTVGEYATRTVTGDRARVCLATLREAAEGSTFIEHALTHLMILVPELAPILARVYHDHSAVHSA